MSHTKQSAHYFRVFLNRTPTKTTALVGVRRSMWHVTASMTIGLGLWYLSWRWNASLNQDALVFSVAVAMAETMMFIGTLLFFYNIWDEGDSEVSPPPTSREELGLEGTGDIRVNIFITSYDEDVELVADSIEAAQQVRVPDRVKLSIYVADDGNRTAMRTVAEAKGAGYIQRDENRGYKAGNLANALFHTDADFIVICDADTQLFPEFLERTLGYFRDSDVAFVQTPHWFYDIPEGQPPETWLVQNFGKKAQFLAPIMRFFMRNRKIGRDPFLSSSDMFFDVIQRRRNRHNASFCCGAGSIHRSEAIFSNALEEQGRMLQKTEKRLGFDCAPQLLPRLDMQPFRYHVSEDIFTSLQQHTKGWRSVYHPEVLARMLSPWSMEASVMQKLKYAGGTFDIILHSDLIWRTGLPWQTRLHYMSTFWSYLSVLWIPILFLAPMVSLFTGLSPVDAYSIEFFIHLIPMLLVNELAVSLGCKGHDIHAGRVLSLTTFHIQLRAFIQVLRGQNPHFPPTSKDPSISGNTRHALPLLGALASMAAAAVFGVWSYSTGSPDHSASLVVVNLFWLGLNALAIARATQAAFWRPRLPDGTLLHSTS